MMLPSPSGSWRLAIAFSGRSAPSPLGRRLPHRHKAGLSPADTLRERPLRSGGFRIALWVLCLLQKDYSHLAPRKIYNFLSLSIKPKVLYLGRKAKKIYVALLRIFFACTVLYGEVQDLRLGSLFLKVV